MAYEISNPIAISLRAGADLSAKQYYFVKASTATEGDCLLYSTTGSGAPLGVLQNAPSSYEVATIWPLGCVSKVATISAIGLGKRIGVSSAGVAVTSGNAVVLGCLYGPTLEASGTTKVEYIPVAIQYAGFRTS